MRHPAEITTVSLDVGGVLLTNGWGHESRALAAKVFDLDPDELEARHHLTFETYEVGKLTLDEYMDWMVFHKKRPFTLARFRRFMFAQSKPHARMIELAARLKTRHGMKVVAVCNEGRELNEHRIRAFKLDRFMDAFVASCYVHARKPDADIFRIDLDIVHVPARQVVYVDDTPMFVGMAKDLGVRGVLHTGYSSTRAQLASLGLLEDK